MTNQEKPIEYHDIILTDIQMHTTEIRKPTPWYRAILKSIKNKVPGRFWGRDLRITKNGMVNFSFPLPSALKQEMENAEKAGKKVRFFVHKDGIPVYLGRDAVERLKADNNKRNKTRFWRA